MNFVARVAELKTRLKDNCSTNHDRLVLYSDSELLGIEIDRKIAEDGNGNSKKEMEDLRHEIELISNAAKLKFAKRKKNVLLKAVDKIDEIIRTVGVWSFLAVSSTFLALPCIFFKPVDYMLVKAGIIDTKYQACVLFKRFIASHVIKLSGIHMVVDGVEQTRFGKDCVLVCFTHASTMDAFIISATIPVRHYTLSKASLFLIPFFSWCLVAFGGVPIDRKNREKAVKSIVMAAKSAQMGDCLCMSPEGTRSKSGQLLPFKKGPFYLWEQMKTPIVPLVITGAFDLYPPGKMMSIPGKVYVKFLKPIQPEEATTRDAMSELARIRVLEALKTMPEDAGSELTWFQRLTNVVYLTAFFSFVYWLFWCSPIPAFLRKHEIPTSTAIFRFLAFSIGITLLIYVYLMYVVYWLEGKSNNNGGGGGGGEEDVGAAAGEAVGEEAASPKKNGKGKKDD